MFLLLLRALQHADYCVSLVRITYLAYQPHVSTMLCAYKCIRTRAFDTFEAAPLIKADETPLQTDQESQSDCSEQPRNLRGQAAPVIGVREIAVLAKQT